MLFGVGFLRSETTESYTWLARMFYECHKSLPRTVVMDGDLTMLIGPASDGALLEIGVLDLDGDDPVVIHAMPLRPKFYRFLG